METPLGRETMDLIPVTTAISVVPGKNNGRFPLSHSFLIRGSKTALIDTGCGIDLLKRLRSEVTLDFILNSHCHPDHSAGNWVFPDKPLHVPFQSMSTLGRLGPLSERLAEPGDLGERWIDYVTGSMGYGEKAPTDFYRDGDVFDFGDCRIVAVHTPGHTEDHHCFFEPEGKILFSFDLDLTSFGPFYGHRESDIGKIRRSMDKIRGLHPEMVISSHREIIRDDIDGEFDRFLEILDAREIKLMEMVSRGLSYREILDSSPFYGRYPYAPELMRYWEGEMIKKHLKEIQGRGLFPDLRYPS